MAAVTNSRIPGVIRRTQFSVQVDSVSISQPVDPGRLRSTQLRSAASAEIAPALLAEVVGVSVGTVFKWTTHHGGNSANYAAGR